MSTTPRNVLQQARQGNPDAIAALMNQHLQARGITAQVTQQGDALHVSLESAHTPAQQDLVAYIKKGVSGLSLADIHHLEISGKQAGHPTADWSETITFNIPAGDGYAQPVKASSPLEDALPNLAQEHGLELEDLDLSAFEGAEQQDSSASDLNGSLDLDLGEALDETESLGSSELLDLDLDSSDLDLDTTDLGDLDLEMTDASTGGSDELDLNLDADDFQEATDELNAALSDLDMPPPTGASLADTAEDELDLGFTADLDALDADASSTEATEGLDFDLDLEESEPAFDDLGFEIEEQPASAPDLALDLDSTSDLAEGNDLDLNVDDEAADLDLDLGLDSEAAADLGSGFNLDLEGATEAPSGLDLNLDASDEDTAGAELDFDAPAESSDLNLNFDDSPEEGADLDLNFDDSPEEGADLDLNFEAAAEAASDLNLDFDFEAAAEADVSGVDLDFESPAEDNADLDLDFDGSTEEVSDLELNFDAPADAASDLELNFDSTETDVSDIDLDFDSPADTASDLDLDFDAVTDSTSDDTDPGAESLDLDFDEFTAAAEAAVSADSAPDQPSEVAEPPMSLGSGLEGDLWASEEEAAPEPTTASPPQALTSDIEWDLDDDLGVAAADSPVAADDSGTDALDIEWDLGETDDADDSLNLADDSDDSPNLASDPEEILADLTEVEASEPKALDFTDFDDTDVPAAMAKDSEPIDLMLSEDLDLSDSEGDDDISDFGFEGETPALDQAQADQHTEATPSAAPWDADLDATVTAAAQAVPQSPVNKLLSEDDLSFTDTTDDEPGPFSEVASDDLSDKPAAPEAAAAFPFEAPAASVESMAFDPEDEALPLDPNPADWPPEPQDEDADDLSFEGGSEGGTEDFMAEDVPVDDGAEDLSVTLESPDEDVAFEGGSEAFTSTAPEDDEDFIAEDVPLDGGVEDLSVTLESVDEDVAFEGGTEDFVPAQPEDTALETPDLAMEEQGIAAEENFNADPGLRPEDFPLFEAKAAASAADQEADGEASDLMAEQPDQQYGQNESTIDTLELDELGDASGGDVMASEFPVDDDEFPLEPQETSASMGSDFVADEDFPAFDASDSVNDNNGFAVDDIDSEFFEAGEANQAAASFEDDWADGDQPDGVDEFINQVTDTDNESVSTSVSLTDEDLDSLDSDSGSGSGGNWLVGLGLGVVCLGLIGVLFNAFMGNRQPGEPVSEQPVEIPVPAEGDPEAPEPESPEQETADPEATQPEEPEPEAEEPAPTEAEPETEPTEPIAEVPAEAQYFREAVNAAQTAANLAQTASTSAEWQAVADSWAEAIDLMKQVPEADPNYATAQQKAIDYQPNLEYAQQNAE